MMSGFSPELMTGDGEYCSRLVITASTRAGCGGLVEVARSLCKSVFGGQAATMGTTWYGANVENTRKLILAEQVTL